MHIVIPMSGTGERFRRAGYATPKPFIEVDGCPMLEHVIRLFPGETRFTFIVNQEHMEQYPVVETLQRLAPEGRIVPIAPHKLGPVHAVRQVFNALADDEEVIVNYCDFGTYWSYRDFLEHTRRREADGAIPCYRGFHPHMLGPTNYAFLRHEHQWMLEIREKKPFTVNRIDEFASNGTYYFRRGQDVKTYFQLLMDRGIEVAGEYYISMVYNLMVEDQKKVSIYEVQHMLQWGTPEDHEEYQRWSRCFARMVEPEEPVSAAPGSIRLIPMAGRGKRFADAGYTLPKPLIEVSGRPMIVQASRCLPPACMRVFACLEEHLEHHLLRQVLEGPEGNRTKAPVAARIVALGSVTEGQAITCALGLGGADLDAPLVVGACDNGMLWNARKYRELIEDPSVDAIAWTVRGHVHARRNPQMYGWVRTRPDGTVETVSCKMAVSETPQRDHAIVGTFTFRTIRLFLEGLAELRRQDLRVNGEFYVDSIIDVLARMGRKVHVFEVDHYIGWGTPDDLKTFEYWQSYFHKSVWHPYDLEKDPAVPPASVMQLDRRYRDFQQEFRGP